MVAAQAVPKESALDTQPVAEVVAAGIAVEFEGRSVALHCAHC